MSNAQGSARPPVAIFPSQQCDPAARLPGFTVAVAAGLPGSRQSICGQLRALNRLRAEALGDLAIGIDASLSGQIDGPVWSVSDRGALDRVAQIAECKIAA